MIRLIAVNEVDNVWPLIAKEMERGCRKARTNINSTDLHRHCRNGTAWLAIATNGEAGILGAVVFEIHERRGRELVIVALCGKDVPAWLPFMLTKWEYLDHWGVTRVTAEGRPGFDRLLKQAMPTIRLIRCSYEWERHADQ